MIEERSEIEVRIEEAQKWASQAGESLIAMQQGVGGIRSKGNIDFVTAADLESQNIIRAGVRGVFAEDGFWFEEAECHLSGETGYQWVVDPLDGTTNYMHGSAHYAVSIGLIYEGTPVGGVIHAPSHGEMFTARSGEGAFLNGRPIQVSDTPNLADALLATGFPYDRRDRLEPLLAEVRRALLLTRGIRRAGAAALDLAYVACGRFDGFWEHGLSWWDVTAGLCLVREAGGHWGGSRFRVEKGTAPEILVIANGELFESICLEIIGEGEIERYSGC